MLDYIPGENDPQGKGIASVPLTRTLGADFPSRFATYLE